MLELLVRELRHLPVNTASSALVDVRVVGVFEENCYLLACRVTREAVIVDPGINAGLILEMAERHEVNVRAILATHGHIDHVGAAAELRERLGVPFRIHEADRFLLEGLPLQAQAFGLDPVPVPEVDGSLEDGGEIAVGRLAVRVIHTPGHTPGGVSLHVGGILFPGDVLFRESVGRTDLPGGDDRALIASIRDRLLPLGDEVRVWPGHGPATTLGHERVHNPFLSWRDDGRWGREGSRGSDE